MITNMQDYFKLFNKTEIVKTKSLNANDDLNKCKYCSKNTIIYDYRNSIQVCSCCGIIVDKIDEHLPEWRYYNSSDTKNSNPIRCGQPINPLLPKSSLCTQITHIGKYKHLSRLHQWNQISPDEKSLYEVFKKIDIFTKNKKINKKIVEETKQYYKLLSEKEKVSGYLTRGNIRVSLIAACLFISCKNNNKPLREIEIANIFGINVKDITKGFKKFNELEKSKNIQINTSINNIHDYINKYCHQLNIKDDIKKLIHLLYIRSKKINILRNNNNSSICSGLIYYISDIFNLNYKKSDIINIIKISEVTLNKVYNEFIKYEKILLLGINKIKFIKFKKINRKKRNKRKN
jgi:transcription initiation factor TFIIB